MTTTTTPGPAARARAVPAATRRPGLRETLRSELTKLLSVRSTHLTLLAFVLAGIGFSVLFSAGKESHWGSAASEAGFSTTPPTLTGIVMLGELVIVVLGALTITSEYGTGMIRTSLSVMPRRLVMYAAKAIVFTAVTLAVSLPTSFASFLAGQAIFASKHANETLGDPNVLRAVMLAGLVVPLFGLLALGLGAIVRHTAGAITALFGLIFLVPALGQALPTSWFRAIERWLPGGNALEPIIRTVGHSSPDSSYLFGAWAQFAVFAGWAAAALIVGGWLLYRRDA
jgi:ABC-2 type transport system permease protein